MKLRIERQAANLLRTENMISLFFMADFHQAMYLKARAEMFIIGNSGELRENMEEIKEKLDKDQMGRLLAIFC